MVCGFGKFVASPQVAFHFSLRILERYFENNVNNEPRELGTKFNVYIPNNMTIKVSRVSVKVSEGWAAYSQIDHEYYSDLSAGIRTVETNKRSWIILIFYRIV